MKKKLYGSLALAVAFVLGATLVQAASASGPSAQDQSSPDRAPVTLRAMGKAVQKVRVVSSVDTQTFATSIPTLLVGANTTIKVTAGARAFLDMRFAAESECYNGVAGNWCVVEIRVDGTQANPASGDDFAFDSSDGTLGDYWESHAMEAWTKVGPGTHTVEVFVYRVGTASFRLDDWTLTVDQSAA